MPDLTLKSTMATKDVEALIKDWALTQGFVAKNFRPKVTVTNGGSQWDAYAVGRFDGYEFDLEKKT